MNTLSAPAVFLPIHPTFVNALYEMGVQSVMDQSDALIQIVSSQLSPCRLAAAHPMQRTNYQGPTLNEWRMTLIEIPDDTEFSSDATLTFQSEDLFIGRSSSLPPKSNAFLKPATLSLHQIHYPERDYCVESGSILNRINKVARIGFLHNFPVSLTIHYHYTNQVCSRVDQYINRFTIEASDQTNSISINRYLLSRLISGGIVTYTPIPETCSIM